MTDFRERYKRAGFGREDLDVNRALRSQRRNEARRDRRDEHLNSLRADFISESTESFSQKHDSDFKNTDTKDKDFCDSGYCKDSESKKKAEDDNEVAIQKRLLELEKWRQEREKKKQKEKKKAKPVFKVGVVHHKVYSPPLNKSQTPALPQKLCKSGKCSQPEPPPKRITRATEKRLAVKAITNQQKRENTRIKKKQEQQSNKERDNILKMTPIAPKDHKFKAPIGITPLPLFGRQAKEGNKALNYDISFNDISLSSSNFSMKTSSIEFTKSTSDFSFNMTQPSSITFGLHKTSTQLFNTKNLTQPYGSYCIDKNATDKSNNSEAEVFFNFSKNNDEIHNDQENIDSNTESDSSLPKSNSFVNKRRSLRNRPPLEEKANEFEKVENLSRSNATTNSEEALSVTASKNRNESHNNQDSMDSNTESDSILSKSHSFINKRRSLRSKSHLEKSTNESKTTDNKSSKKLSSSLEQTDNLDSTRDITMDVECDVDDTVKRKSIRLATHKSSNKEDEITAEKKNVPVQNKSNSPISKKRFSKRNNTMEVDDDEDTVSVENNHQETKNRSDTSLSRNSGKRKSTTAFKGETSVSEDFVLELPETPTKESKSPSSKTISNKNISPSNNTKKLNRESSSVKRRSMRQKSNNSTLLDVSLELTKQADNIKLDDVPNLMDFTFSEPPRGFRRPTFIPADLENQSLIKFSPRSSRIHKRLDTITDTKGEIEALNESTSSEPSSNLPLENTDKNVQNLSFNMSLPKENDKPPAFFSPYIVASRGKNSVRKEIKNRLSQSFKPEDIPTKDTVMQNLNISVEEEERTAQYYKFILNREIERLNERCDTWNKIKESPDIPEDIIYQVQAAVGHTQLLINKKFERFRGLVLDCESGKGEMLVTCKDLQGFWDMMYMEIKDCDNRFNNLEILKEKNWVEEDQKVEKAKKVVKKKPVIKKPPTKNKAATSSLRALIMAARKKKEENKNEDGDVEMPEGIVQFANSNSSTSQISTPPKVVRRNTSTPMSVGRRHSLIQKVQTQKNKITTSPLIQMKIGQMCKTPEVHLDESIVYINSDRTPAKGILKSNRDDANKSMKQSNKVIFNEQPMECEFDKEDQILNIEPTERKLNFEDSFNSSNSDDNEKINTDVDPVIFNVNNKPLVTITYASPNISISSLTLDESKKESKVTKRPRKQITFKFSDDEENDMQPTRRSSRFSVPVTPKPKQKNLVDKEAEEENCEMEVDTNTYSDSPRPDEQLETVNEFYMNSQGVVSQRVVSVQKDTPRLMKLKRSNSERVQKTNDVTPSSSRLRRRSSAREKQLSSTPAGQSTTEMNESPCNAAIGRQRKKESSADRTLTEEQNNDDSTPKNKTTLRTPKTKKSLVGAETKNEQSSSGSKLRRTKSLVGNIVRENEIVEKPNTQKLHRSSSLRKARSNTNDDNKDIVTPKKNHFSGRLHDDNEPEEQKTDSNTSIKLSRTSSLKRKSSLMPKKNQESSEGTMNATLTPNSRRTSMRTRVRYQD